jgi:hypothetical protein
MILTMQWNPKTQREPRKLLHVWFPDDQNARAKFTGPDMTREEILRVKQAAVAAQNWADSFLIQVDKEKTVAQ